MNDRPKEYNADDASAKEGTTSTRKMIDPEEDGRNKEWQDRARVNLEEVPEGTKTIVERDYEPEKLNDEETAADKQEENEQPAY